MRCDSARKGCLGFSGLRIREVSAQFNQFLSQVLEVGCAQSHFLDELFPIIEGLLAHFPAFRRDVYLHYPLVLRVTLPSYMPHCLQPLQQRCKSA